MRRAPLSLSPLPRAGEGREGARSPVGVPPRLTPSGLAPVRRQLQARLPGTRQDVRSGTLAPTGERRPRALTRSLAAPACPSPGNAPPGPVIVPANMMPEAARKRSVSFRARAPHSLHLQEYPRPKASFTERDSLGDYLPVDKGSRTPILCLRDRLALGFQGLNPISILIALGVASTLLPWAGHANASMPSSFSADASASACTWIEGDETKAPTQYKTCTPVLDMAENPAGKASPTTLGGGVQLASRNAPAICLHKFRASSTPGAIDPTNCRPAYCLSFSPIRARCSGDRRLGALNFSRAAWASKALAFASATMPSPALFARFSRISSPQTPATIRTLETIVSTPSKNGFLRMKTAAISTTKPTIISFATRSAQSELNPYSDWRLPSLPLFMGLIRPGPRRRSGSLQTLAGIATIGGLIALAALIVLHCLGRWP